MQWYSIWYEVLWTNVMWWWNGKSEKLKENKIEEKNSENKSKGNVWKVSSKCHKVYNEIYKLFLPLKNEFDQVWLECIVIFDKSHHKTQNIKIAFNLSNEI